MNTPTSATFLESDRSRGQSLFSRTACAALNGLIVACKNDAIVQGAASGNMANGEARRWLRDRATEREAFVEVLGAMVVDLGGTAAKHASMGDWALSLLRRVRTAGIGPHTGDGYKVCARVERKTAAAYGRALHRQFPGDMKSVIESQRAQIELDYTELRRLRNLQ